MFGCCNLCTGDYGHITIEHASKLFRNHLSVREYSNQGFEAAHSLQHQLYSKAASHDRHAWSCYIKLVLYSTFLVLYFFNITIHLNTTILQTNIVTYLNIVRTKLTTLYRKVRKLIMSFSHFFVIPQMMHRVHKDMKSS